MCVWGERDREGPALGLHLDGWVGFYEDFPTLSPCGVRHIICVRSSNKIRTIKRQSCHLLAINAHTLLQERGNGWGERDREGAALGLHLGGCLPGAARHLSDSPHRLLRDGLICHKTFQMGPICYDPICYETFQTPSVMERFKWVAPLKAAAPMQHNLLREGESVRERARDRDRGKKKRDILR